VIKAEFTASLLQSSV